MPVIKVACSECGQRVSGDETFYGTTVKCPICAADIRFPRGPEEEASVGSGPLPHQPSATPAQPETAIQQVPPPPGMEAIGRVPEPPAEPSAPEGPTLASMSSSKKAASESHAVPLVETKSEASGGDLGPLPLITMICGIASVLCSPLAILGGPAAIVLGHLTMMRMGQEGITKGKGFAITGLILGYFSLVVLLLITVVYVTWFKNGVAVPE